VKHLIEQAGETALDANASEINVRLIEALKDRIDPNRLRDIEWRRIDGNGVPVRMPSQAVMDQVDAILDFQALALAAAPDRSPSLLAGHVLQERPDKPDPLDANATGQQRLEWISAMQQWKRNRAAWTKQIKKSWTDKKVHWITTNAFTRMGDSKDANSVTVLALVPVVLQRKGNARIDTVELVLRRCVGPAAALARKMVDPNGHISAVDIRGSIETIEMVPAKSSDRKSVV